MTAYYACGIALAAWAVIVSVVGITREDFPATPGAQRAVAAVSLVLALATIGSAIYTGANEDEDEGGEPEQALILRV